MGPPGPTGATGAHANESESPLAGAVPLAKESGYLDPGWIPLFSVGATGPGNKGLVPGPNYGTQSLATLRADGSWSLPRWSELDDRPSNLVGAGFSDAVYSVNNQPIGFDYGYEGAMPSATVPPVGSIYIATDTHRIFRTDGSSWEEIGGRGPIFKGDTIRTNAEASVYIIGSGVIDSWYISNPGSGYDPANPPNVTVYDNVGEGSGAFITALVSAEGHITDLVITQGGLDYYSPYIVIDPPPSPSPSVAGLVPAASPGDADLGKFLGAEGQWRAVPHFQAGGSGTAPITGLVTGPSTYDTGKFLRGDGTWAYPTAELFTAGASGSSPGTQGSVPGPSSDDVLAGSFLRADGTWHALGVFQAGLSGSNGTNGLVPWPDQKGRGSVDATEFLNASGHWSKPVAPPMQGATDSEAGLSGTVPVPQIGANHLYLRGDGTWAFPGFKTFIGDPTIPETVQEFHEQAEEASFYLDVNNGISSISLPMVSGYAAPPTVGIYDDVEEGTGASGYATLTEGIVYITITNAGYGYIHPYIRLTPAELSAGAVPAPHAGDAVANKFLKADGTWSTVPVFQAGQSGGGGASYGKAGLVPGPTYAQALGNNFLRADGTWASPAVTGQAVPADGNTLVQRDADGGIKQTATYIGIRTKIADSTPITIGTTESVLIIKSTDNSTQIVNLPNAVDNAGRKITIKRVNLANNVSLSANDSAKIDGVSSFVFPGGVAVVTFVCDGVDWYSLFNQVMVP